MPCQYEERRGGEAQRNSKGDIYLRYVSERGECFLQGLRFDFRAQITHEYVVMLCKGRNHKEQEGKRVKRNAITLCIKCIKTSGAYEKC